MLTAISPPLPVTKQLVSFNRIRAKPTEQFYRPELDVLRFFAFLAVFLHHSLPGFELGHHSGRLVSVFWFETLLKESGSFGVCLFFLLSAYLITELLQRERDRTGKINLGSFYLRRILRIWPLYFLFLFCGVIIGEFFGPYRIEGARLCAFLLLAANWYVAAVSCGASPIAPLWSISLEEQFYLVWPWIAKWMKKEIMFGFSLLLVPISWFAFARLVHGGAHADRTVWVNSFVQFQFFGLGAVLALTLKGRTLRLSSIVRAALLSAGITAWLTAQGLYHIKDEGAVPHVQSLIFGYTMVAIGCACLFLGFLGMPHQWLSKHLTYLGKISYGLYVFQMLALDFTWKLALYLFSDLGVLSPPSAVVRSLLIETTALALTIFLAIASYRFLEQPFLRIKQRFAVVESRTI